MQNLKFGQKLTSSIVFLLKFYQQTIGHVLPRACRFEPTCSNYAIQAITRFGLRKGFTLSIWRLVRCTPFSQGGLDPVPELKGKE